MKNILETLFEHKMRLNKIKRSLKRINKNKVRGIDNYNKNIIRASCVQRQIKMVSSIDEYIDIIHRFVRKASLERSDIVIFPEYNFFDLFGLIPGFKILNQYFDNKTLNHKGLVNKKSNRTNNMNFLIKLFETISIPSQSAIEEIMVNLAKAYNIYIYTGTYLIKEGEKLYNGGALISSEGKIIGRQKKVHLTDFEDAIKIERGSVITNYQTDLGNISCPVCMDATYFETFEIVKEAGADIVILPIANMEEYNMWRALRGIWPRVQESHVFGLKASLNGWIGGMHFTGKAGIFAPIDMTTKKDGIISISPEPEGDFLVTGDIDISKLQKERETAEYFGDRNIDFEKNYFDMTY